MIYLYYVRRSTLHIILYTGGDALISADVIRGYVDLMILFLLLEQDSYGYEISKQIRTISEDKYTMKETTLYSAFTRLEKSEYITSYAGSVTNGKKRTYYKITEKGRMYYLEKCKEWELLQVVVNKFIK